ncbi:hypothetical protein WAX74_03895 [Psychrobacillus sp. FJAT-51614]|uniref:SbsC C-terminal domain-containing protein n=1 Tax=Psychrobacillus mangrovi TaxID=3117745 RepID=A0ABU8F1B8_9BACI
MGKRFWKQTAAAVLLTSSVLSFSSVTSANTSVDQSINKVKAELNRGTTHYVNPALNGQLVPSSKLYQALNSAKINYQKTRNVVSTSNLSSAQKQSKIKELDTLYNEKISRGLIPYIDAYNYATKYLVPILNEINAAESRNDFATVEKEYHKLSYQLKGRSAILYRFSGKAARDLLLDNYKKTADSKRDELMVPVTIYMKIVKINDLLANGKNAEAIALYAEIDALLNRLPNASTNKFVAALLEEVKKVKTAIDGISTSAQQEILTTKVESLVTELNTTPNFSNIATASTTGTNSLTVTINNDLPIVVFLGQGFFTTFNTQLGVTHINGFEPASAEAVSFLQTKFVGVDSLADLKGKNVSLPVTVNNGSPLNVDFTITFQ